MLSTPESLIENLREGVNTSQMTFLPRYLTTLSFILKLFFSGKCFAPPPTHLTELMCFLAIDWAIFFLHVKEFYCNMCCLTSTYKLDPPMSHLWWTHHKLIPSRTASSINTSVSVFIKLWLFFSKLGNFAFMFGSWWPIYFFYSSPIFFRLVTLISLFHIKCIIAHCLLHHWIWSFAVHFWAWEQALQGKEGAGGERVRKMNG